MTSDMSGTHYNGEEISAETYATLRRHHFNLESLEERLQRMENTTATMKEKWRRGDEAMRDFSASIDDSPPRPHTMKSQKDFHSREEIDQLVEGIYRALETTEERLDGRCDDIYFPMDLSISALTSKIEAIQGELVEI
ncbi:hypothetical protein DY000_02006662 [Brassica cretica]|uniref:DUF5082 domain-containing protein n=1 Tax=Brassica cretica TaxID=69181 RepID=A0ABQ7C8E0_BRACR|nr:hypothetical protein DY000_02006662 [Brassica cretica]